MAADKVKICSVPSLLVGGNDFGSFDEDLREAKLSAALYDNTKSVLLMQNAWRFSLRQFQLSKLLAKPLYDFDFAYQVPNDALRISSAVGAADFQIIGDKIYSNADNLMITYQQDVSEQFFPPYFTRVLELQMAAMLSIPLTEDKVKFQLWEEKARTELLKAKNVDSQSQTNLSLPPNTFWLTVVR